MSTEKLRELHPQITSPQRQFLKRIRRAHPYAYGVWPREYLLLQGAEMKGLVTIVDVDEHPPPAVYLVELTRRGFAVVEQQETR